MQSFDTYPHISPSPINGNTSKPANSTSLVQKMNIKAELHQEMLNSQKKVSPQDDKHAVLTLQSKLNQERMNVSIR